MNSFKMSFLGALLILAGGAMAQDYPGGWRVDAPRSLKPGEIAEINIVFDLNAPWYVYAPSRANEALGVTGVDVALTPPAGLAISKPTYPRPTDNGQYQIYDDASVAIDQKVRAKTHAQKGEYLIEGFLEYQFCKPDLCLPPQRDSIAIEIEVE